jgi:hypothetical protein
LDECNSGMGFMYIFVHMGVKKLSQISSSNKFMRAL